MVRQSRTAFFFRAHRYRWDGHQIRGNPICGRRIRGPVLRCDLSAKRTEEGPARSEAPADRGKTGWKREWPMRTRAVDRSFNEELKTGVTRCAASRKEALRGSQA